MALAGAWNVRLGLANGKQWEGGERFWMADNASHLLKTGRKVQERIKESMNTIRSQYMN